MKNKVLQLSAVCFLIALIAAGCGQAAPDPAVEAQKGAALKAEEKKHDDDLAKQGQQSSHR